MQRAAHIDVSDITTVAALVGHADPKTTAKYDTRGERAKEAIAFINVPYYGPAVADSAADSSIRIERR